MITHATLLKAAEALAQDKGWKHIICPSDNKWYHWEEKPFPVVNQCAVFCPEGLDPSGTWVQVVNGTNRIVVSGVDGNCYLNLLLDKFKKGFLIEIKDGRIIRASIKDRRSMKGTDELEKALKIITEAV